MKFRVCIGLFLVLFVWLSFCFSVFADNSYVERNPTVLYDDDYTWFGYGSGGSGGLGLSMAEEDSIVVFGGKSFNVDVGAGAVAYVYVSHAFWYSDFSGNDTFVFWVYGDGSSADVSLAILCPDWSNYLSYDFVIDFSGWKQFAVEFSDMSVVGAPDLSYVGILFFYFYDSCNVYFDHIVLDGDSFVPSVGLGSVFAVGLLVGVVLFVCLMVWLRRR